MKNSTTQMSSAGVVSAEKSYDAFGNVVSASGVWKSQFGFAGKFGYQSDPDTGLKLLGHRYYDSDTGRFLTRDPIKDGRNWYSYCENNPVSGVDPSGLTWYYDQATGNLWWDDPSTELFDVEFIDNGFSGKKGDGRDDPSMESKKGKGPIPKGRYKMGFGKNKTRSGRKMDCIWLDPHRSNKMHGRDGFLIHGGSRSADPSEGCVIMSAETRRKIEQSGDDDFVVYSSDDRNSSLWYPVAPGVNAPTFLPLRNPRPKYQGAL